MAFVANTLSTLVALIFLLAGAQKVLLRDPVTANLLRLGVGPTMTRSIGALEVAGALGLAAGIWFKPLAITAATGLTLLLLGAVGFHLRARDFTHRRHRSHAVAPVVLAVVTGTTMALLLATS
ncbi:DoxX family protein [Nonomuraea muscovyensis]|uniref:Putative membrane protein YphA (DoxX/SURF4 family) n=1 Tax=Nonomuraea muscovyensis TaxID=1124761 RepID=A0A7X0C396_9ACTN|nr:DoxX family protein [Nonomuraea muscovyensis]MBB6347698.1 putative membrane protein YphA (DoxX/SURF4 family) [Nonomuraea muscovyensis]